MLLLFSTSLFAQRTAKPKMNQKNNTHKTKPQAKKKKEGWGDVGLAKENNGYIGETEKNRNKAVRTNKLIDGDDPFGKTKKKNQPKRQNDYANQEVSY